MKGEIYWADYNQKQYTGEAEIVKIFKFLSNEDDLFISKKRELRFESAVLERDCEIANDQINAVIDDLLTLKLIWKQDLTINGESRVLYYSRPSHKLLVVLLMTREIGYKGAYSLQSHLRNMPFIKE